MMSETISLLPRPLLLAGVAYLGTAWLLGGAFSERLADQHHIPACISGIKASEARAAVNRPPSGREVAEKMMEGLTKGLPPLKEHPLLGVIDGMLSSIPRSAKPQSNATGRCRCLASAAREESQFDHMLWVASIRFYRPEGVGNFQGLMTRLDRQGVCGKKGE